MTAPVSVVEGRAIPLGLKNVDTDVIIPAHWLKTVSREMPPGPCSIWA
jgi:3-isopropylmalate/(R)-2-methylmalate dehydratase small subunit